MCVCVCMCVAACVRVCVRVLARESVASVGVSARAPTPPHSSSKKVRRLKTAHGTPQQHLRRFYRKIVSIENFDALKFTTRILYYC